MNTRPGWRQHGGHPLHRGFQIPDMFRHADEDQQVDRRRGDQVIGQGAALDGHLVKFAGQAAAHRRWIQAGHARVTACFKCDSSRPVAQPISTMRVPVSGREFPDPPHRGAESFLVELDGLPAPDGCSYLDMSR